MGLTRTGDAGDYETFSETIGALIKREWDTTNSNISDGLGGANGEGALVKFIYNEDDTDPSNLTAMQPAIVFNDGSSFPIPERTGLGLGLIGMGSIVIIDVFGESQKQRRLYEFEIYRILRKNRPTANSDPIKKSNNSDNSSIHDYDEAMPEFIAFDDGLNGKEISSRSSAILTLLEEWLWS